MAGISVYPLDLNFQDRTQAIGAFLVKHKHGGVLVESGPGSTIPALQAALAAHDLAVSDITHVLLTHIHLDHAGAAGWLARQGAQIYVHPVGAPHMLNPEKLLASATRLYGDQMDTLWGEFLPVPAQNLNALEDGQVIDVGELQFKAIFTPGHAEHHCAYLLDDICFTGDVGGVRIPGYRYLRLPLVPPELNLEKWIDSVHRLQELSPARLAPTHYGIFGDADWHLWTLLEGLQSTMHWAERVMPADPSIEQLRRDYVEYLEAEGRAAGVGEDVLQVYQIANPTWISADGLQRYWRKHRQAG
jgi:glyoxylase-like metal-dependent hydrolase (beta-lactamase superfamily II)